MSGSSSTTRYWPVFFEHAPPPFSPALAGTLLGKRGRDRGSRTLPRRDFDSARERRGHEVVNDGHAEAGRALAASGRVEGLEDSVPRFRCHAATRIPNNDCETVVPSVAGLAEYDFHRPASPSRVGITFHVGEQVQQDLTEEAAVTDPMRKTLRPAASCRRGS